MKDFIAFFGEFIVVIAVAGMFYALAPDGAQKKYIHFAISLSVLAAIMGPMISVVSSLPEHLEDLRWEITDEQDDTEENLTDSVVALSKRNIEASVVSILSQKYGLPTESFEVSVTLDDTDAANIKILAVEVKVSGASLIKREEMKRYLSELFMEQSEIKIIGVSLG